MLLFLFACSTTSQPSAAGPTPASAGPAKAAPSPAAGERSDTDIAGIEAALAKGELVLDVRTQPEWDQGHIPGAKHLPLSELSAEHALLTEYDKAQHVYLVCQSGGRSSMAADKLAAAGFKAVNFTGGTGAWAKAGKPLDK